LVPHAGKHCFIEEEFGSDDEQEPEPYAAQHQVIDVRQIAPPCEIQVLDDEERKGSPAVRKGVSPQKRKVQRVLEEFGFGEFKRKRSNDPDQEGLGAAQFANSLDYSDVRLSIKQAMEDCDEVALSAAIDVAREIGWDYPHRKELEVAEGFLMDLMQCPDGGASPKSK